ncbi:MAG: hypothetical protein ABS36_01315 [Acidobacteria bacterium SCN 69-37]|nr:MAG: hypothetical protein ABS36_01315 [Acidobacteria bacterium SCN 69-37]
MTLNTAQLQAELLSQLAVPFTGETLFDSVSDVVFFMKNERGEYVVVNQTLVERCGCRDKRDLVGRRADDVFPKPLGDACRASDESVLHDRTAVLHELELHFYPSRERGWCLTTKLPLHDSRGRVIGLVGLSKDLPSGDVEDYSVVARAVRHIQHHIDTPLRVGDLAMQSGLSAYQFEQRIQQVFHLTAGQLIRRVRMEAAMQRLRDTADSIATIALDCGYSDQSAFTRQFRRAIGQSPSAYRLVSQRRD